MRRIGSSLGTAAVGGALGALTLTLGLAGAPPASAAPLGPAPALFPSDSLTVRDTLQRTGKRINLPLPDCDLRPTDCNDVRLLNRLDGFDLDPRITVAVGKPLSAAAVSAAAGQVTLVRQPVRAGDPVIGLERVVFDPATDTLAGHPTQQLAPGTRYKLRVSAAVTGKSSSTQFTTLSATADLDKMRDQIDSGRAASYAGISPADSQLDFRGPDGKPAVFDRSTLAGITRFDDVGPGPLRPAPAFDLAARVGTIAFGSYLAPSWLAPDRVIPQVGTATGGPYPLGRERVGVVLLEPAGTPPAGGWPVLVFGHGFTGNRLNVLLAADTNAARGYATLAIDVVGHGYGPRSEIGVTRTDGSQVRLPAYGRGLDQNRDGRIDSTEGVSAPVQPYRAASVASRDGLRQTVADLMTLVRDVPGADVNGDGQPDLAPVSGYYGQSFGGIYGTMLGGTDPKVPVLVPNVAGGPITEIARLSPSFRPLVTQDLALRQPSLLNGGLALFTEDLPLRGDPPVTSPAPGSIAIQEVLARTEWLDRSGGPETYAPGLSGDARRGVPAKKVLLQVAFGDQTVPNPTASTLIRAGRLENQVSLYRNDLTPNAARNPHGFLLDPSFGAARSGAQDQALTFLTSGGTKVIDPDGAGPVFEVPARNLNRLERLNFSYS